MEGNETDQQEKHGTGFDETENLEISQENDGFNGENVICESKKT